tara:strand:+ start:1416 stop:2192 length:777 start_codon:yes stop_codon:yes gene_type:complete
MSDTEKKDYLSVDEPINGQNFICMSFVSPEKLIHEYNAFQMCKFLQSYCKEQELKYDEVYSKYEDYVYKYSEDLRRDYDEKNEYKTSMRGVKVRGAFTTKQEAEDQARKLSRTDSTFNVFVGQMGYWLPWDPCADNVDKEVFQDEQLNTLMEGYEKNNVSREIFYEEVKSDKLQKAKDEYLTAKKKRQEEEQNVSQLEELEDVVVEDVEGVVVEDVEDVVVEDVDYTVNADLEQSISDIDPWMAKKIEESNPHTETQE